MPGATFTDNKITNPVWAGDFLSRDHLIPGPMELDPAQFQSADAVIVTLTADAAANAVIIFFSALSGPIPANTPLYFGGSKKLAYTTAAAPEGAVSVAVQALPTALVTGDTGYYNGLNATRRIEAGTFVGRTFTERDAGTAFGPWAANDDEAFLIAFDVPDALIDVTFTAVRPKSVIKENLLPGWASYSDPKKAALRAAYQTQTGSVV